MKRMLDQKTIDELQALLSEITIDENDNVTINSLTSDFIHLAGDDYGGEIMMTSLLRIVDGEDSPLFPFENNAGKVLAVNEDEDGLQVVALPSGGTQLYKHHITKNIMGSPESFDVINTSSIPFNPSSFSDWRVYFLGSAIKSYSGNHMIAWITYPDEEFMNIYIITQDGVEMLYREISSYDITSDVVTPL